MKTNTSNTLDAIIHQSIPEQPVELCIIWLHGLGADGHDFEPIMQELSISTQKNIRFIFPHAPMRPITINNGYVMRGWYDIKGFDLSDRIDEAGITNSIQAIEALIDQEIDKGLRPDQIVLAGFSQGGVIALLAGLQSNTGLAGIIGLSCYLPQQPAIPDDTTLPIFMAHGTQDPVVPLMLGEAALQQLKQSDLNIEWHTYLMGHSVCAEEINDLNEWLLKLS